MPILREAIKSRLIQMEEALFIASGQRFEAESEAAAEAAYLSNQGGHCHASPACRTMPVPGFQPECVASA